MAVPPTSQQTPLPQDLPFRLITKTIATGAYASIRKAIPLDASGPVLAVKFINKEHAFRIGRLSPRQIALELSLHHSVSGHKNIIRFLQYGQNEHWTWLAMELAAGGDLFDKIEADVGVPETIAHLYFTQLIAAVDWCHSKGVAHRDIKPENILLGADGDLKLADFGLAEQFKDLKSGMTKTSSLVCGSPPYIAAEIIQAGLANNKRKKGDEDKRGYDAHLADIWSCAIVLFVLCAGNTPWDLPDASESWEYSEFIKTNGRPDDELWHNMSAEMLDLIRGMLEVNVSARMPLEDVKRHPWFAPPNPHLDKNGRIANGVGVATVLLGELHIDMPKQKPMDEKVPPNKEVTPDKEVPTSQPPMRMEVDSVHIDASRAHPGWSKFGASESHTPTTELTFNWEPSRLAIYSASQPLGHNNDAAFREQLSQDPGMSQFALTQGVPLTLTQNAKKFQDILPSHSLTRFLSEAPLNQLVATVTAALRDLGVPVAPMEGLSYNMKDRQVAIRIKTQDSRRQPLHGNVVIEHLSGDIHEVRFVKAKGDPIGWRRVFKRLAILCQSVILRPRE